MKTFTHDANKETITIGNYLNITHTDRSQALLETLIGSRISGTVEEWITRLHLKVSGWDRKLTHASVVIANVIGVKSASLLIQFPNGEYEGHDGGGLSKTTNCWFI